MSNEFRDYLLNRIRQKNYRGYHLSQHNRLPFDKVSKILKIIYEVAQEQKFNIHIGDDKGSKQKGCETYYQIVEKINQTIGQSTINSLKKNIFPDFEAMGFIERFDKNGKIIDKKVDSKKTIYSVKLTPLGKRYVFENNPKEQYRMYIKATEKILQKIIDDLFILLYQEFDSISVWEFMFIFSDPDISLERKTQLIKKSRQMTNLQHIHLRNEIQNIFNEINQTAKNKTEKRDFSNWYNETLQILNLLNQTIYFKTFKKTVLMLALSQEALEFNATRSENAKIKALLWHEISQKKSDYEFHHIFPLEYATCNKDLELIDDYRNLIYISQKSHKKIPKKNNLFLQIAYENNRLILHNPFDKNLFLDITHDSVFKIDNIPEMINYNRKILNEAVSILNKN